MAQTFDRLAAMASSGKSFSRQGLSQPKADRNALPGVVSVNDNSTDLDFSGYDGITQSTTSTAMCGNQVVVGFNDTGSSLQTFFNGTGGVSMSGAAVSSDGGKTFLDIGAVNPGPDFTNFLEGDPVVTCSDSRTFYYTQVSSHLFVVPGFSFAFDSSISLSISADGGNTWGDPQAAVTKDFNHLLDKPWSAIDPSNPQRLYISYTDFDNSFFSAGCGFQTRTAIELVISNDGGQSFGSPIIIDEQCGDNVGVQTSHVAFNSHGLAYIVWQRFNPDNTTEVRITHVAADGSVAPSVKVDQKVFGGDTFAVDTEDNAPAAGVNSVVELETDLQGEFRDLDGLDLAVDRSGGPKDGMVYVTWDDARNKSVPDLAGFTVATDPTVATTTIDQALLQQFPTSQIFLPFTPLVVTAGNYAYTDVLVSSSRDGVHFGPSIQVNSDGQPKVGGGHDHFQPGIATDATGRVAICWYDRRNDPQNLLIERFCAGSGNGRDWPNFKVPISPFAPIHRLDFGLLQFTGSFFNPDYMGDYDGLTSDFMGKTKGFIGAFQWMSSGMNPDVKAYQFQ
jgi:hypothetical protein